MNEGLTMTKLAAKGLPSTPRERLANWPHLDGVSIREIDDKDVGLIKDCDVSEAHYTLGEKSGSPRQPFATKTVLVSTVLGPWNESLKEDKRANGNKIGLVTETQLPVHTFGARSPLLCASADLRKSTELEVGNAQDIVRSALQDNCIHDCVTPATAFGGGDGMDTRPVEMIGKAALLD